MFIIVLGQHVSILIKGPEDDSIRIETYCPNKINKPNKVLSCLTDTSLHIYIDVHYARMRLSQTKN